MTHHQANDLMKPFLSLLLFITAIHPLFSQGLAPVEVADMVIKIPPLSTHELAYGFAEGDQLLFSFEEAKGKALKEIEIIELPGNSRFADFKTDKVGTKRLQVHQTGVYLFRFSNTALSGRIARIHIQRIPRDEASIAFNTHWEWQTLYDTTYTPYQEDSLAGYEITEITKKRRTLVEVDTIVTELCNKKVRVHSQTKMGKTNISTVPFSLPQNSYLPVSILPYESTEVLAWAYWIGVGEKSFESYKKTVAQIGDLAGTAAGHIPGAGPLYQLAISGISMLMIPAVGDNVDYSLRQIVEGQYHPVNHGNVVASAVRNIELLQGDFLLHLQNDNLTRGIDVEVRVIVVRVHKKWKDLPYTIEKKEPRYVTVNKTRIDIQTRRVRVNAH